MDRDNQALHFGSGETVGEGRFTLERKLGQVQGGLMYGATDEVGMHAVENRVHVHPVVQAEALCSQVGPNRNGPWGSSKCA